MAIFACVGLFYAPPSEALTFSDNFNGSAINSFWWAPSASGGNTLAQTGGSLVMTQSNSSGSSGMGLNFQITGDFVMQVSYTLVNWPSSNYERVGLGSGVGTVERSNNPGWFNDAYLTDFDVVGGGIVWTNTSDLSGTLELVRSGDTISGYYLNGSSIWTLIYSYTTPAIANPTSVGFAIWNGTASVPVTVDFNNFSISAPGTLPAMVRCKTCCSFFQ